MTYFHTGIRTIIGAESFHCPVRDGKEWDRLAMVIRHNCVLGLFFGRPSEFIEPISLVFNQIILTASLGITALMDFIKVIGSSRTSN